MKLKMIMLMVLVSSGALLGTANLASAAIQDEVKGSEDGKGGTSHGYIKLTPGDDDTGVTKPIEETDPPGGTDNEGVLTLDNVAPLLFDTHKLEGKEQVYKSIVNNSNIQVTDKRGDEAGWNVQVSQTVFQDVTDNTKKLKGTTLVLPIGTFKNAGANVSLAPILMSVEVNDKPAVLMNAAKGSGAGTWANIFEKDEITLTIPAGNKTGEYLSTITWSLLDAPV
ncbi:WxL domain-containing protein [Carnobacterium maltaromaticum]|uniref:WxL domain-containing protein n=1 Tax=Carnobacterium maltaromaticum TaxID=2751 RepID=UPI00295EAB4E|nr:WxL domain-containing protein [Carnobacterium maltaromaticum]